MAKWLYYTKHFPQPEMGGGEETSLFFLKKEIALVKLKQLVKLAKEVQKLSK
jgi:hypothetical protein